MRGEREKEESQTREKRERGRGKDRGDRDTGAEERGTLRKGGGGEREGGREGEGGRERRRGGGEANATLPLLTQRGRWRWTGKCRAGFLN